MTEQLASTGHPVSSGHSYAPSRPRWWTVSLDLPGVNQPHAQQRNLGRSPSCPHAGLSHALLGPQWTPSLRYEQGPGLPSVLLFLIKRNDYLPLSLGKIWGDFLRTRNGHLLSSTEQITGVSRGSTTSSEAPEMDACLGAGGK